MIRELLTATGGDREELALWIDAVQDTGTDKAALEAYKAKTVWWPALMDANQRLLSQSQKLAGPLRPVSASGKSEKGRGRPASAKFEVLDYLLRLMAESRPRDKTLSAIIREVVAEAWEAEKKAGRRPDLALGASIPAATRRIFARFRPEVFQSKGGTIWMERAQFDDSPDWSGGLVAHVQSRTRGVFKMGRPRKRKGDFK
jgi:hypothetical protein